MIHDPLNFLIGDELASLTLVIGVAASVGVRRLSGVNPGGIIAAAFIVLAAAGSIVWAAAIPFVALAVAWLYKRYFSHIFIGRMPLFIMAGMSVFIMSGIGALLAAANMLSLNDYSLPIGIVTPAIMAWVISRQGRWRTISYTLLTASLTLSLMLGLYAAGRWFGHDFHAIDHLAAAREHLRLSWQSLLSLASIIVGAGMYYFYGVKPAGYVMLPLLSTLAIVSPLNLCLLLAVAYLTYLIVSYVKRYSLLVGVSRYVYVVVVATVLTWAIQYLLLRITPDASPFMGTGIFAALAVAILVNENILYGARKAMPALVASVAVMAVIEVAGVFGVQALQHQPLSIRQYAVVEPASNPTDTKHH